MDDFASGLSLDSGLGLGVVAQPGERLSGRQEVAGAIPADSTKATSGHRPTARPQPSKLPMRVRFPLPAPRTSRGGNSRVEAGVASSGIRVRFPVAAPCLVSTMDVQAGPNRTAGGSTPPRGSPAPGLVRGSRSPPIRPHLLAGQGCDSLKVATRVRTPLGTPGNAASRRVLGREAPRDPPTSRVPFLLSLSRRRRALVYESGCLRSTRSREATSPLASVLAAPDASVRSSPAGFDSRQRLRREGETHPRLITSVSQVRFLPLHPATARGEGRLS